VPADKPSILLVTLDTTRADAVGPDAVGIETPAINAIAAAGLRFRQAYAPVPETLPSHASMLTGLYPAGHGIRENARTLQAGHVVAAERLRTAGYATAAFVSSFTLSARFGLARGFDVYDETFPGGRAERTAAETTDAALAYVASAPRQPLFLWVHYYDPHHPYTPPPPYGERFAHAPYLGEVAYMDEQIGRLVKAFTGRSGRPPAIIVVSDHGEGLGEHGEDLHGNLVYQATMHVPLIVAGPGIRSGVSETPVSVRRVFHTLLDWAGIDASGSLRHAPAEVVLGEAMRPFLAYGWQPQVMAVDGRHKAILAGRVEVFDVVGDPGEVRDLAGDTDVAARIPRELREYPVPATAVARTPDVLDEQARRELASLGYVSAGVAPVVRKGAPRPADMVDLFETLDRASGLFVSGRYRDVIPLLDRILARDPYNLDAVLRLATSYSMLGQDQRAVAMFQKAVGLAPDSMDVRMYLAAHYARGAAWERAIPLLDQVLSVWPDRLPALEALALVRERQGRLGDAVELRQRVVRLRTPSGAELAALGALAMQADRTAAAIEAFEGARSLGHSPAHDLELGALYLAARQFDRARDALDRVPATHPDYAMALFKRAQVSVLLHESDRAARIERARRGASAETRVLIENERLFREQVGSSGKGQGTRGQGGKGARGIPCLSLAPSP
jgi:arylsulfatase A-like enzyme/Tfp pilus assembly protein PilF